MSLDATLLAEQIIRAILGGSLPAGTRLDRQGTDTADALMDKALDQVCACGMAERHPDLGVRVTVPDPVLLLDRFEALGEISGLCASLAARRASPSDMIAIEELVGRMQDVDPDAYRRMGLDLHDRICRMTKNAELGRVCGDLRWRLAPIWPLWLDHAEYWRRSMHEHRALVEAICARDEAQAGVIMRGHLRAIAREVLFTAGICPTDPV